MGQTDPRVERLSRLDACAVSDAMDKLGPEAAVAGLPPLPVARRPAGRVAAVKLHAGPAPPGPPRHLGTTAVEEAVAVVAEDQEQVGKILSVELPRVRHVIVPEPRGLRRYRDPRLVSFEEVEALGGRHEAEHPGLFDELVSATGANDLAFLIYTSGTTGFPKGAMISHRNILAQARAVAEAVGLGPRDSVVSYLPLCHVAEQIFSVFLPLWLGMTVNFAETLRTIQEDLREIAPSVFLGVPRIWEKLQASIVVKMGTS